MKKLLWLLALSILGSGRLAAFESGPNRDTYYAKGLEQKQSGDFSQALKTWLTGSQKLQRQGKSDPQIGFAFIELATEMQARQAYEMACQIYLWGFSRCDLKTHRKEIEKEIKRLAPLLEDREHDAWKRLLKKGDGLLVEKINQFWRKRDPTPSTSKNERLLEHWERIAYARKNFNMANSTAYGTDDRGTIYVRYGRADRKKSGFLGTNRARMKRWSGVIQEISGSQDLSDVGGNVLAQAVGQNMILETIDRYNHSPDYEIWFYRQDDGQDPVFFLFGSREGSGSFGLRDGLEDFIPRSAFLQSSAMYTNGILPGAVLQALYYSELAFVHPYFEDRYYDLESRWDNLDRTGSSAIVSFNAGVRGRRRLYEGVDKVFEANAYLPPDESNFDKMVSDVNLVLHPFRFLDRERGPMMALTAFSFPKIKGQFLDTKSSQLVPKYSIAHTLVVSNRAAQEVQRQQDFLPSGRGNLSSFIFVHDRNQNQFEVITEVFAPETQRSDLTDSTLSQGAQAIGLGRASLEAEAPLSGATDQLELSDLIIGVDIPNRSGISGLPFPVIPSPRILLGDLLKIYIEVYHLEFDQESMAHFKIAFEAAKLKGKKKSQKETISLSFNFDSPTSDSKESFQVDTTKLTPGYYELLLTVRDTVSGQTKQRVEVFEMEAK